MFGYIRACKPELKIKEYETYKAVYCSLCKKLGKNYGLLSRLTLSYDFTFLALLNAALSDENLCFEQKRCAFNPLKKCNYCKKEKDAFLDFPAAAAMIMLYYKICDNIADEGFFKALLFRTIKPIFKGARNKAMKQYPELEAVIFDYINKQNTAEKAEESTLDDLCNPTAEVLSKILAFLSQNDTEQKVLSRLGYCLGRYIYILDAACDLEEDIRKNRFNVLKQIKRDEVQKKVKEQLYFCINESALAFELLDIKKFKTILGNIIYLGLEDTFIKELKR